MDVSVVITCWNGIKLLEKNLPSVLKAAKNPKNKIVEVLVVDDGSTDNSVEFIESFKDANLPAGKAGFQSFKVKLVRHEKNLGYSATCNTGVKEAKGELVAILNLDVTPENDFLEATLPHFADSKIFAVSFNEGKYGPGKLQWKDGFLEIVPSEISQQTEESDWANGGSSIFRKKIWEKLGGMDEIFLPFYFEDIDLGVRARKAGFICLWEPDSRVEHKHEATINKENFKEEYINSIKQRNHLLLTWRNLVNIRFFLIHLFYLFERCLFHPKYTKMVLFASRRLVSNR